ncbi:MAG: DUF3159 domain-containing protein [Anaerolineales bacterium]|nr:DUF3159 domain-containing protein [Anaerolineales bacterium]
MTKIQELGEELRSVLSGRGSRLVDSFLPLLIFLVFNPLIGVNSSLLMAVASAAFFAIIRLLRRESLVYSIGGLGGVVLAAIFVIISGSERGFFLPGLISGSITVILCVVSVALNRPVVAWTSFIARRWPLNWYWHPKVLPAYNEVTILWGVAFAARLGFEFWLYQRDALDALGATRILLGWPYIIVLLVITYLYGIWRLRNLAGPSVEEFNQSKAPPWESQRRGF